MANNRNNKNSVGRPVKYTPAVIKKLKQDLENYIDNTKIPILAEFAYKNKPYVPRQYLYEFEELSDTIKRLRDKKEMVLELGGLSGKLNPTMCIFSLKQLGWKDRQEIDHTTKGEKINNIEVVVKGRRSKLLNMIETDSKKKK